MEEHYLPNGRFVKTSSGRLAYFLGIDDEINDSNEIFLYTSRNRENDEIEIEIGGGKLSKVNGELHLCPFWVYDEPYKKVDLIGFGNVIKKLKEDAEAKLSLKCQ